MREYAPTDGARPSTELLSGHDVLALLIRDLYAPAAVRGFGQSSSASSSERQQSVRTLIAVATAGAEHDGAAARPSVAETEEALACASRLLHAIIADASLRVSEDEGESDAVTRRAVGNTASAHVILYCLGRFVHRRHLHEDAQDRPIMESLELISRISAAHPGLRPGVLAALVAAVDPDVGAAADGGDGGDGGAGGDEGRGGDDPAIIRLASGAGSLGYADRFFIDRRAFELMFALVLRGYVLPPLAFLRRWSRGVRVTQQQKVFIREGVGDLLGRTRGPYGARFTAEVHEIVRHVGQPKGDGFRRFLEHSSGA